MVKYLIPWGGDAYGMSMVTLIQYLMVHGLDSKLHGRDDSGIENLNGKEWWPRGRIGTLSIFSVQESIVSRIDCFRNRLFQEPVFRISMVRKRGSGFKTHVSSRYPFAIHVDQFVIFPKWPVSMSKTHVCHHCYRLHTSSLFRVFLSSIDFDVHLVGDKKRKRRKRGREGKEK